MLLYFYFCFCFYKIICTNGEKTRTSLYDDNNFCDRSVFLSPVINRQMPHAETVIVIVLV